MAMEFNWDLIEKDKQMQIRILKDRYDTVCQDLIKEKRALKYCADAKKLARHNLNVKQLEKKKAGFKHVFLTKYGLKLETRGRPPLPPEKRAMSNKTKLTVRVKKENAEYMALLKKDKQIDTYGQFFDFLIKVFRQQNRQG